MTIEIEYYYDDDELTGIENDILYYINKYNFLTLTELQWIFKLERKSLKNELKKLINKSYLEQRIYHNNTVIYFSPGDFQNSNREQKILDIVAKILKKQKISYENMFERLKELKLCFDKKIFDVIIHNTLTIGIINLNKKLLLVNNSNHKTNKKVSFCPLCSSIIVKRTCRACDYIVD